ncbi:hypothetical protein K7X08_007953 [Anisodus acutangulus]|uniref:Uncharacterized protein n=1 Tax=Anisodus acutangulus TaxID=402998 RepID=A0A9Q1MPF5_9SOLA|nr:hypothetical protein K7X08_007953 [Anisodus acutangulus]
MEYPTNSDVPQMEGERKKKNIATTESEYIISTFQGSFFFGQKRRANCKVHFSSVQSFSDLILPSIFFSPNSELRTPNCHLYR